MTIRVFITDDHPVVRDGLVARFSGHPDFEVAGTATTLEETLREAPTSGCDVVILDVQLSKVLTVEGVRSLGEQDVSIVLYTSRRYDGGMATLAAVGARGFVHKADALEVLDDALRIVAQGGLVLPEVATSDDREAWLTTREREVFALLARCRTPKEVAAELGLAPSTTYKHIDRVRRKLGLATLAEVSRYAAKRGH